MTISITQAQIFFLTLTRVLATIIHVPILGGRSIPNQIKISLGILLTMFMLPWQPILPDTQTMDAIAFGLSMGREILIGTIAGFAAVLTFGAFQIAGNMIGLGSGFGSGQILNPALEDTGSSIDQILIMTAFLIFIAMNGHHIFILGLSQTFQLLPVNSPLPNFSIQTLLGLSSGMITAGVHMALPLVGTLLLADLTLGLLARVAPQMHVFFLGIPLKVGLGLLALSFSLILLLPNMTSLFESMGKRMLMLLGG